MFQLARRKKKKKSFVLNCDDSMASLPGVLFYAGKLAASRAVNVHLVVDLSSLPSHFQNLFPQLR